ncbi:MAG: hemagglutinin repeat-containing protein [Proteobacteria bacterium]|nr:hemagglutinin repeat-containing protein [Pseudomonadota bacterium]
MHPRTRAILNRLAQRLSAADHALKTQLTQPMSGPAPRPWLRRVARVFTSLFIAQTVMAGVPAYAQVTAAPGAPAGQKPLIDAAANGTPIVLIAPPSQRGVSRNQYDQLNVGPKGLILNNSTANVQTQIGGWISGNLQLGRTPARIILNEVTGPQASQLRGTIEVGGQKADIVIANPNGITCSGCGFLNADRATLTTGTPQIGANGTVTGFDVRQGVIQIGPEGLNATEQQQLDLHARGLVIEGEVYSQNLQAVIGANQVVYGTLHALVQATAQDGTGEAPRLAVDIKALGGMYAGQIYLIATDKGLGVNSTGRAATLSGNLVLSANGDLTLKDTYATGDVRLASAGKTTLTGQTVADGAVTINAGDQLTHSGALQAPTLQLNAPALHNSGSITQTKAGANLGLTLPGGLNNSGQIYTPGNLTVQAGAVSTGAAHGTMTGQLSAGGSLQVSAAQLQLTGQQLAANGNITLDASGKLDVTGTTVSANGQTRLAGSEIALERARIAAVGNVQITSQGVVTANAADISSNATLSVQGSRVDVSAATMTAVVTASIKADGEIKLDGSQLAAGQRVELVGQGISTPGATVTADKITIDAGAGALTNPGGKILASSAEADALTVNATGITNQGGELRANGGLTLDARGGVIDNTAGVIAGTTGALTNLGGLTNKGGILYTQSDLSIASTALDNSEGAIVTAGSLSVSTPGQTINNTKGLMQAGGSVSLDSGSADLKSADGTVVAGTQLTVNAGTVDTAEGTLAAGTDMTVTAGQLQAGSAKLGSGGAMNITASGNAGLGTAEVGAGGDLSIQAGTVQATGANVASNANVQVTGGSITGGNWSAQGNLAATSAGALNVTGGSLLAGGDLTAQGQGIVTDNARLGGQTVTLNAGTGALSNVGGQIHGRANLHIQASHLANRNGTVATGGALTLQGAALENHAGTLQAAGNLTIHTAGQALDNTAGKIISGGNTIVQAGALSNSGGTISAGGTAHVQAAALNTVQGQISGTRQLDILVTQRLTAVGATLGTEGKFTASAGEIDARSATATAGETLAVASSGALDMRSATITAQGPQAGDIQITGGSVTAGNAAITGGAGVALASGGAIDVDAANIAALRTLAVQAGAALTADAATIQTNEQLTITGTTVAATGATLSAGGKAEVTATTGAATLNNVSLMAGDTAAVTAVGIAATGASIGAVNNVTLNAGTGDFTAPNALVQSQSASISLNAANVNVTGSPAAGAAPTTGLLAGQAIAITATGAVDVSGAATYAGTDITITAQGSIINNAGRIIAGNQASLSGAVLNNRGGTIDANGPIAVSVTTGQVNNDQGRISTRDVLTMSTPTGGAAGPLTSLTNAGGVIETTGALNAQLQNFNNEGGSVVALAGLTITGGPVTNTGGQLASQGNVSVNTQGGAFNGDDGKVLSTLGNIILTAGATTLNSATVTSGGSTTFTTGDLQASQARIGAQGNFNATASGAVTADRAVMAAGGSAGIAATQGIAVNGGSVSAQTIRLDAGSGVLNNTSGNLTARTTTGTAMTLQGQGLTNDGGMIASNADLSINAGAGSSSNAAGQILAVGAADIRSTGLNNVGGTIAANGNLTINAAQAHANAATDSTGGTIQSGQNIALTAGSTTLTNATITSGGNTTLSTAALQANQARINAGGNFSATSSAAVTAQQLALAVGGSAAITAAQGIDLSGGNVSAQTINATAGGVLNNTSGNLTASATTGTALTMQSQGLVNDQGTIASNAGLSINATTGSASNAAGRVLALGVADVRSTGMSNVGGTMTSNGNLTINTVQAHANAAIDSTGGTLQSGQNITLTAGATTLTNATVTSGGNTTLNTAALQANQARINAQGNFSTTSSAAVTAQQLALAAGGSAVITATQGIDLSGGSVSAQTITMNAGGVLNNTSGNLTASATTGTALTMQSQGLVNDQGTIASNAGLSINETTGSISNTAGRVLALGAAEMRSTGLANVGGTIASNGNLTINAAQAHANAATDSTGGMLQSGQNITLTAGATTLTNATVTSGGNTTLNTAELQANQARINALGNFSATSSAAVTAQQLALAAGGSAAITATQGIDLSRGSVSAQTIALSAGGVLNNTGGNLHAGATTGDALTLQSQGLVNDQGTIASNAGLSMQANTGSVSNAAGRVLALGAADVRSTGLNNAAGTIASNGDLTINTVQAHANAATDSTGGTLQSGQNIALAAGSTTLTHATVTSGGNTTLTTGVLQASQARINALGNFTATSSGAVMADRMALAAGGSAAITAAQGIDVNRGSVSAQTINLNAGGGALNNNAGSIQAVGALDIRSTGLNNRAGTIASNGDLTLNATLANAIATLDSTDGAVRSAQAITLTAGATTLTNATVTSGGNTTLNTADLQASQARINTLGNLTATASGAVTADQVTLAAGGSAAITATQGIDVNRGTVSAQTVNLNAGGILNNNAGSLTATGAADIRSAGLTNVDGTIASNGALTVNAAQANTDAGTNNTRGTIRSAQSSVTLTTGALNNANADIGAAEDVRITATGALTNDQARIVAGRDLTLGANAVGNTSGLIAGNRNATLTVGAGGVTNTSGTIQAANDLTVTSAGDVANTSGQLLAGHQLTLSGAALTNSQGQIGAQTGSATLAVTSYINIGGSVVAGGALTLDTQGGALTANGSTLASGADMTLRAGAAQLSDAAITAGGSINAQVTSLEATRANVQAAGNLSATAGAGAFNAANSTWQAGQAVALTGGAVAVTDATVSANTTVAVTGASVDATRASITSPGDVSVVATHGALDITHASLLAGRDLTATGTGAGTTTGAQALAGRDLTLGNGTAFDFAAANLQYQFGRDLTVRAQGISTAGQQVSARNLTLDAGSGQLNNQGGTLQATGTLTASGTGLNNQSGVIAANGAVTASAGTGTLNNAGGKIYSTQGATSVAGAAIANATGTLSAATDVSITGGTLNNSGNTIAAGRNLTATLSGAVNNAGGRLIANTGAASVMAGDVNNATGVISGSHSVTMTTRAINNEGGVIESGAGGISIDTQGHTLTNTDSGTTRGIVSQGNIAIAAGDIKNQLGYIGANGSLNITQSSTIHNQGGTLLGLGGVSVTTGMLNNQGGSVLGGVDVNVNAGTVNNGNSGTIYAARDLTVNANSIDNSNTRNGAYTTGLLAGRNASITASTINNASGAIVALGDATVRASSSLNNTQGQISGNAVTIQTPSLTNTAGRADAQQRMTLQVPQFSADGVLASNGAMNLELQGNYVNTGVVSASGDLSISTTGSYTNLNRVSAQNSLSLTAAGIDNASNATIDSQRTTLNAGGGTINNAGLINSTQGQTSIAAGTLNNTGRIYGDSITLSASVNNSAAAGNGAAIATRGGSVTINGALNNTDDALVLSLGNIQINGSARNDGSTINAMGNVTITGPLTNTHVGLQTGSQTRTDPAHAVYITPSGSTTRYNVGDLAWTGHSGGHWVLPSATYPLGSFGADPKAPAMQCGLDGNGGEGGNWVCNPGYGVQDPIWALMGVASPGNPPPDMAMGCMDFGGETGNAQRITSGACGSYWVSVDAYEASKANAYAQLDNRINAFNADLNARTLIDWYETTITGTTITETTVVPGRAAKVLAGGNISIGGGSNIDSIIVAAGSLNGGGMSNIATQGTRQTSATGYQVFSHRTWSGGFSSSYGRETSAPQPIADAPVTETLTLPVLQYQSNGNPSGPAAGGSSTPVGGATASVVGVGRNIGTARNASGAGTASAAVQAGTPTAATGGAVQVDATTTAQAQSAAAVNGAQITGGSAVTAGAGNTPAGSGAVITGTGAAPTGSTAVTAGTGANPTGNAALTASTGNNATSGTAVTTSPNTNPNTGGTVQATAGTQPNGAITASLSAAPDAALPGSVIAAGVRAGQLAAITTSLTNFAAAAAIQPKQASEVDTSTRRSAPVTVKAAGYSTVRASGAVRAPGNQLFSINRNPRAPLVETDPAFTGYRNWISSAYMLQQLALDPERNLKLYGDGFAEQRLIDDQILALTGRRFLSGYQSTEDQYHDLMDAGVIFAKAYQLTPGVALSAEQMALLTTDIVWLEAKEVTLPDGSTTMALVPTVYLRRPTSGDLSPTGALIAGSNVTLRSPSDLTNSGTIIANGDAANGDGKLTVTGNNVNNSGTLAGNQIAITAANTLNNIGGVVQGLGTGSTASLNARDIILRTTTQSSTASIEGPNGTSTGTRTNADRIATVSAESVKLAALNNISLAGAVVNATGNLAMTAGNAITSEAVQTGYTLNTPLGGSHSGRTGYMAEAATKQQLTTLAGNNVAITATGDAAFKGTNIKATNDLAVTAKTITIDAVKESLALDQQGIGRKGYERVGTSDETLAGANVTAGNHATITATGGNITGTGATIIATHGAATLTASGDVGLNAAATQHSTLAESFNASKGVFSSKSSLRESDSQATLAQGSSVSGKTVAIVGGRDVNIHGSSVVSDTQTTISAARNVNITAATQTLESNSYTEDKRSGLGAMGGISYGKREQSTDTDTTATRAAASNIASLKGNVSISAGQTYNQVGSNVMTPVGNVDITAKAVSITAARETNTAETEQKFKQSGISVNATGAIATAIHTMDSLAEQAGKAKDGRMQGLAALAGAVEAKKALDAIEALAKDPANAGSIGISISLGTQKNESSSQSQSNTAAGSTVAAGNNVTITAQGAGADSDITVQGSQISAANITSLKADGQVNLLAAQNTSEQNSQNSGSSASIGVGITFGQRTGISFNASASASKGNSDGSDLTHVNTQVTGGQLVNIQSGGDTTLKGAVVSGPTVNANVGGNLKIESLQDTAQFDEKQSNAGFGVTLCIPPLCIGSSSATVSAGKTNINSNYQSVTEQSGIKAGDGGFNVNVLGATDLKGGVISSTVKAHNDGKNSFASAGGVTLTDIQNSASYNAKGVSITAGYSGAPQDGNGNPVKDKDGNVIGGKPIGGGGIGSDKGSTSSTTQAGITGIAGNTAARTGDSETGIKPIFDAATVRDNINAQVSITATALPVVAKGWADFANEQERTAKTQQDKDCWKEGGACRVAGHVAIGALAGGASGAAGAGVSQAVVPTIGDALRDTNLPDAVKQVIVAGLGVAIGAAAGGTAGAITGGNATVNNYLTQAQWKAMADERAKCADKACRDGVDTRYAGISASQDEALRQACMNLNSATCRGMVNEAVSGSATQQTLVASGALPPNYLGGRDFNSNVNLFVQKIQAQDVVNACAANAAQCDQSRLAGSVRLLMTATVVAASAAAVTVLGAEAAALAAFARNPVLYCTQSPTACMAGVELALCAAAGPACPPGTLVPTASQLATVKQVVADAEAAAAGRVAGTAGGGSSAAGGVRTTGAAGGSGANGGVVPSGFANANEFANFGGNVRAGLKSAGYPDAEPILQGSAVTGKSFGTGAPFDAGRVSDFDVALASPALLQRAQDLGIGVRSGGTRTGPLSARDLEALGLTKFASDISAQAGREVNFMIYQSSAAAMQRAPSISLPGGK